LSVLSSLAGLSGLAMISLQKVDSLLVFLDVWEAKKVSYDVMLERLGV
jgi:hypothetical protein